jgi:homoserine dehydrogenase
MPVSGSLPGKRIDRKLKKLASPKNLKSPLRFGSKARGVPVVLAGFGHVGKAFFGLVQEKHDYLQKRLGLDFRFKAILKSDGGYVFASGATGAKKPALPIELSPAGSRWSPGLAAEAVLKADRPGVFVECTPSNIRTGEPGLGHVRAALKAGWHVVTANKGPLAVDFKGLRSLAYANQRHLKFSAATAAALPTLDVGLYSLAGADVLSIEGILNGTTNYVLTKMGEGISYKQALKGAQDRGIAEPNPALDVEGWDTAVKLLLIGNFVLGLDLTLADIKVEGITGIRPELWRSAREEGKAVKLIGRIARTGTRWEAAVAPELVAAAHPLFGVSGTNKGITFLTDTMGSVTVSGGKSDPRGAAAALLKDIIHIFCG